MILTKRDSLERFIREQMEGPGACNGQFYRLDSMGANSIDEEVINTTPGSLYSTAVLFPQRKHVDISSEGGDSNTQGSDPDLVSDSNYQESQEDNSSEELDETVNRLDADDEDLYSLSQRFPTTIGLSCCLDKDGAPLSSSDLTITVSGRYYTKISNKDCCSIVVRVDDEDGFNAFFNNYSSQLSQYFARVSAINVSYDGE